MQRITTTLATLAAVGLSASGAFAAITITQGTSAPAYGDVITFDEPGAPVGVPADPLTFYDGIEFQSNSPPSLAIDDWDAIAGIDGGEGDGNQLAGGFGIRMYFDEPTTNASWQGWADGSPDPPFGGINVFVFSEGVQIGFYSGSAPFGGLGDEWFDVTADGETFDEIVFFNGAFNSFTAYMDNVSFSAIPAPGALALLGVAGAFGRRRRRA